MQNDIKLEDLANYAETGKFDWNRFSGDVFWDRIERNHAFVDGLIKQNADVYGITTGFGRDNTTPVPVGQHIELQNKLIAFHGCGQGNFLSEDQCAATMFARLCSLSQTYSGVDRSLIEQMKVMLSRRVIPAIPELGSVGASGDLTPLSYVAAAVCGLRKSYYSGKIVPTEEAFKEERITPYVLKGRDSLALMNGTSMMTGIAGLAWVRTNRIAATMTQLSSLLVEVLGGRSAAFHPALHDKKPHLGQKRVASQIFALLKDADNRIYRSDSGLKQQQQNDPIQDVYSVRCVPQALGPLFDVLDSSRQYFETELNSVNDNPIFDDERELVLHGGHFYGGHLSVASDNLKIALTHAANLSERQIALLMSGNIHAKIDHNLIAHRDDDNSGAVSHGFKAVHILASAVAAEIVHKSTPASTLSRPTESYNQDVVSMGSIATRSLSEVVLLCEILTTVLAATLSQALFAREEVNDPASLSPSNQGFVERVRGVLSPMTQDRSLDLDLIALKEDLFRCGVDRESYES